MTYAEGSSILIRLSALYATRLSHFSATLTTDLRVRYIECAGNGEIKK